MLSTIVSYLKQFLVSIRARDQDEEEHSAEERQSMLEMANVFDFFQSLVEGQHTAMQNFIREQVCC